MHNLTIYFMHEVLTKLIWGSITIYSAATGLSEQFPKTPVSLSTLFLQPARGYVLT